AEIRATPVDEGAEGNATCIIEPDPFGEPGEDAAGRCRIARTEEEVCGRVGRRDKDGPESRAQLDHGRKCDGAPVVDDRRAAADEEAAARSRFARRRDFRELMDGTHFSSNVHHFDGLAPVPHPGEKGHIAPIVERYRLELGENADATENYGGFHARRGDRSQPALAGEEHTGCSPTTGQPGEKGDAAFLVDDGRRGPAKARAQPAALVPNRIAGDRDRRNLPVGLGKEYPLL